MFKVGDIVRWNDPAIHEYSEEDREYVENREFEIVEIKGEVILISDEFSEAEVTENELELLYPKK